MLYCTALRWRRCRYDDLKTAQENIDLQSTILSRFDLIFIVKDTREHDMAVGGGAGAGGQAGRHQAAAMAQPCTDTPKWSVWSVWSVWRLSRPAGLPLLAAC